MSFARGCRVFALALCAGVMSLVAARTGAAQDLALGVAAGPSPYDLSGTGTGAAGAVLLAMAPTSRAGG